MKKVLLIVALLTLSLAFTYGQATVGGWGRGIFVPLIFSPDGDPTAASMVSWGPGGTRVGFGINGGSDNVGFRADVIVDNGAVGVGDAQMIWVKPIEMLTISVGSLFDDTLRGNGGFVANNWLRYDFAMAGDDYTFGRVGYGGNVNFEVSLAPVDGAYMYVGLGGRGGIDLQGYMWGYDDDDDPDTPNVPYDAPLELMFKGGQYGAGYDIAGIGVIRAQYLGAGDMGTINAAFKLTMVEGLMLDLGAFIDTDSEATGRIATIALYGNYVMDTLTLHLAADMTLPEADGADMPIGLGLGVEYGLEGGLTIQGDVRLSLVGDDTAFAGGAFAKWSYSNGIFGLGLELTNSSFANWGSFLVDKGAADDIVFAIPIRLEYWF